MFNEPSVLTIECESGRIAAIGKEISSCVRPGEKWILFDRNGAGKTMLLELITGYLQSSGGSIKCFGIGYGEGCDIRSIRKKSATSAPHWQA